MTIVHATPYTCTCGHRGNFFAEDGDVAVACPECGEIIWLMPEDLLDGLEPDDTVQ
jgi:hypothetical protein